METECFALDCFVFYGVACSGFEFESAEAAQNRILIQRK